MNRKQEVLRAAFPDESEPGVPVYSRRGDVYHALAYADLFWPPLIRVRGAVVLGVGGNTVEWVEEGVNSLLALPEARRPSWGDVVGRFNWFEVPHLFGFLPDPQNWQDAASYELAEVLRESWSARLEAELPDRAFQVSINNPRGGCDPHALNISVRQIDPPLWAPDDV